MKISDPGALTFQEEETLNTSNSIPFPAGQNTSEPISSSEYIELSTIKQTETDFDRQRNTTTPPNIFNISNRFELANYSNLIDSYGEAGSRPKILYNTAEARAIEEEEGGVKIIDLNQYPYNKPDNILPKKTQQKVGVVLTKRPSSGVTLEVSLSENQDLKVLNPTLTFTPENWNIPQEIKLKGCASPDASLTFRAKANAQGGFKGTEQDELTVLFKQQRISSFVPKESLATRNTSQARATHSANQC